MAKRVNVYVLTQDRNEIQEIRNKYHVSLSTLADEVANKYMFYEPIKAKMDNYLFKGGQKLSIKPKNDVHIFKDNHSKIYSNCLYIFINRLDKELLMEADYKKVREAINKALQTKKETFWQYNETIRNQRRSMKENKEYWKRTLETL